MRPTRSAAAGGPPAAEGAEGCNRCRAAESPAREQGDNFPYSLHRTSFRGGELEVVAAMWGRKTLRRNAIADVNTHTVRGRARVVVCCLVPAGEDLKEAARNLKERDSGCGKTDSAGAAERDRQDRSGGVCQDVGGIWRGAGFNRRNGAGLARSGAGGEGHQRPDRLSGDAGRAREDAASARARRTALHSRQS